MTQGEVLTLMWDVAVDPVKRGILSSAERMKALRR
jgi:hypothetical protein